MSSADFKFTSIVYLMMIEVTDTVEILLTVEFKYWDEIYLEISKAADDP